MAAATASAIVTAVRDRITAAVAGVNLADHLQGVQPQQRRHKGVAVWRQGTRNTEAYRDQDLARVQDTIVVEISYRVSPKAQHTSAQAARDLCDDVIQVVADCDEATLAPYHPIFLGEDEQHLGEWVVTRQRYRLTRDQQLGGS